MKNFLSLTAIILLSIAAQAQTIQTFAGDGALGFSGEGGPAINARFNRPVGVVADRWGNVYLASDVNNVIQKIDTFGILTRCAGNGLIGYSGDGGPATAAKLSLNGYVGMAVDSIGNLYFSDSVMVRKVDTSGTISTVAGNGLAGYSGDGGLATAAQLYYPMGICIDKAGNLYILDNITNVVRKVNTAGIISTFAGGGSFYMDGQPATNVKLGGGVSIAVDDLGNIYLSDAVPFNYDRIRKINTAGIITTVAGGGTTTGSCNGCPATSLKLITPWGIAIDHHGNIFVAAATNELIHKISPGELAFHIAGTGSSGFSGDGGPATLAALNGPLMLCLDKNGDLLFADMNNYRFRKITLSNTAVHLFPEPQPTLQIFPNPHSGSNFTVSVFSSDTEEGSISVLNAFGQNIYTSKIFTNVTKNIFLPLPSGLYLITAHTATEVTTAFMICE